MIKTPGGFEEAYLKAVDEYNHPCLIICKGCPAREAKDLMFKEDVHCILCDCIAEQITGQYLEKRR